MDNDGRGGTRLDGKNMGDVWSTIPSSSIFSDHPLNAAHVPAGRLAGSRGAQFPADRPFGSYLNVDER